MRLAASRCLSIATARPAGAASGLFRGASFSRAAHVGSMRDARGGQTGFLRSETTAREGAGLGLGFGASKRFLSVSFNPNNSSSSPSHEAWSKESAQGKEENTKKEESQGQGNSSNNSGSESKKSSGSVVDPFVENVSKVIMINRRLFTWFLIISGLSIGATLFALLNYPQVRNTVSYGINGSLRFLSCCATVSLSFFLFLSSTSFDSLSFLSTRSFSLPLHVFSFV